MSQNFSRMSSTYIPELMELDSYWQKAVEDAIYDTLKGEKRLHYALRNRKKINEKLERLGLTALRSHVSFSGRGQNSSESVDNNHKRLKQNNTSNTEVDSWEGNSVITVSSDHVEGVLSQKIQDPRRASLTPVKSRSKSKGHKETTPEKKYKNPDRPILGDGSLEKMKKSQNSFCSEPMGMEDTLMPFKGKAFKKFKPNIEKLKKDLTSIKEDDEKNKIVEWLHVRRNKTFDDSDTETSNISHDNLKKDNFQQISYNDDKVLFKSEAETSRNILKNKSNHRKIPMALDPTEDIFWENEVKNAIREKGGLERKLYFALAKRQIINENLKGLRIGEEENKIHIDEKLATKRRNNMKYLSPFIKFYLQVYRELCHKYPVRHIANEAATRWWQKSFKKKAKTKKSYK